MELAGKLERIAEVEAHGLFGRDHAAEQAGFGLIFDIADGERTDAEQITVAPVDDPLLADTRFYFLRVDRRGRLWAGGGNGVDVAAVAEGFL